jgi:hypothetical protein
MLKILNPAIHGVLDYLLALAFLFAPPLFGFGDDAANVSYIVGVTYLGVSLLTRYPLGAVPLIPFTIHGVAETVMAISWIVGPWVLGFAHEAAARNFFVTAGAGLLAVVALTDYRSSGPRVYGGEERRRRLVDRRQRYVAVRPDRRAGQRDRRTYSHQFSAG